MRRRRGGCLAPAEWSELIDGVASPLVREVHMQHIARCEACRDKYASLSFAVGSVKEFARDDVLPPADLRLNVKRRLAWSGQLPLRRRFAGLWVAVSLVVAVCLGSLGLILGRSNLPVKARSYIDLYAESYTRAEGLVRQEVVPFSIGPWEDVR